MKNVYLFYNPFLTNVPLNTKSGIVTFSVKEQVDDLHFYLKYHSSTGVFSTFC